MQKDLRFYNASFVQQPKQTVSLKDVVQVIYRRKWLIVGLWLTVFVTVAAATFLMSPVYVASAMILLKKERVNTIVSPGEEVSSVVKPQESPEVLYSEVEIFKSSSLLREVVRNTGLEQTLAAAADAPETGSDYLQTQAILKLQRDLDIVVIPKSNIIQVGYESVDARLAARVVNELCRRYVDRHLQVHESVGIYTFFQRQARALHDTMQTAAEALKSYAAEHNLTQPQQQQDLLLQQLADYETRLNGVRAGRREAGQQILFLEKQVSTVPLRIQAQSRVSHTDALTALHGELDSVRAQYKASLASKPREAMPTADARAREARSLKARMAQLEETILREEMTPPQDLSAYINQSTIEMFSELTRTRTKLIGLRAQESELAATVKELRERVQKLEQASLTYEALKNQWQLHQSNYLLYVKKQEEARISEALDREKVANVSVIDTASVPLKPVRPNRQLNLAMGFVLAFFVSFGVAFALSYFDPTAHTQGDIERQLNVPVIVTIRDDEWQPRMLRAPGEVMDIQSENTNGQ